MSDLDDKLREILAKVKFYPTVEIPPSEAIAAIKQAFTEAGHKKFTNRLDLETHNLTHTDKPLMTGQEWYDRFEKEMYFLIAMVWDDHKEHHEILDREQILEAAKKAAGLE